MSKGKAALGIQVWLIATSMAVVVYGQTAPGTQAAPASLSASATPAAIPSAIGASSPAPSAIKPITVAAIVAPPSVPTDPSHASVLSGQPTVAIPSASPSEGLQTAALVAPVGASHDDITAGQRLFAQTNDGSENDPFSWSVHIYKGKHRVELYFKNQLYRTYHAVFGRSRWGGGKLWEGDSRTPEGAYLIVEKHRSARFDWFLRLNYPNGIDQEKFAKARATHEIPASAREGGMVGIHGTDSPVLNIRDVNWTLGCVSLDNRDIDEMAELLPIGTLVVINP